MKYLSPLFILSLFLAFITGQLITQFDPDRVPEASEVKEISQVLDEVVQTISPIMRLDLNTIYRDKNVWELFVNNPTFVSNNRNTNIDECERDSFSSQYINKKEQIWLDFQCLRIMRLPANFFQSPPLVAPNGESYLYKAYKSARYPFREYSWIARNLNLFKPTELKELHINLNSEFRLLSALNNTQTQLLLKNAKMIKVDDLILLKTGYFQYYIIQVSKLNKILSASMFKISNQNNQCSFVVGNVCWRFKEISILKQLTNKTDLSFIITIFLLVFLSSLVYKTINTQKLEQERKKHAFRILTHELRTPISSLLLQLERLTSNAKGMDRDMQTSLLEIESEVYRLKNLATKSESILNADKVDQFQFNIDHIHDLKDFIEDNIKQDDVLIELPRDLKIKTDLYWFRMCLQNIVDNAYKHGEPPVKIYSTTEGNTLNLIIQDQGQLPSKNISRLSENFNSDKGGLGLGLSIVKKTLKELEMDFKIKSIKPTEFVIKIKLES